MAQAETFLASGQLWHYLKPTYRFNRHLLDAAPIDRQSADC